MSLQLSASNSLNRLYEKIESDLKQTHAVESVFYRPIIVTQTEGINNWLKIQLAEGLGIAAHYAFLSPNDLIARIYFLLGGNRKPPLTKDQLQWLIYELIGTEDFIARFPNIHAYYSDHELKRLSLSVKTADLFDQYQIYRTEHIRRWSSTYEEQAHEHQWQHYLWYQIVQRTGDAYAHKTSMNEVILEALTKPEQVIKLRNNFPAVYFFGLAVITPAYLQIFHALSEHIDIHFYLINPAPEQYWMDTQTEKKIFLKLQQLNKPRKHDFPEHYAIGNDLLLNWGGIIRSGFSMLFKDERFINLYDESAALPFLTCDSLLQKIQKDIYENAAFENRESLQRQDYEDGSVLIQSAYTPAREVEMLYNYLVDLIETRKAVLSPKDIVVMVSDVDAYAPYIRAVFDNAPYHFPHTIADESLVSGNTIFSAIQLVLSLREDQLTVETVLELIENKYIAARFGIKNPKLIRSVLSQSGIRFGIEGQSYNDTRYLSWTYGLKRIMYGICVSGAPLYDDGDDKFYPLDRVEGDDSFEMTRFYAFTNMLLHYLDIRKQNRTLTAWIDYLKSMVNDLIFEAGVKEDDDFHLFIRQTDQLDEARTFNQTPIPFDVFRTGFADKLQSEKRTRSFLRGGVTFCSYIPMRSIPFKVVCMLGLNFDQFPRKENPLSFSLFNEKLPGDRNVKENDKHLFLENILSAQHFLYLSYVGNSVKDGSPVPPSALVDELIDYMLKKTDDDPKEMRSLFVKHHPLHGFSRQYFNGSGLVNYLSDARFNSGLQLTRHENVQQAFDFSQIELKNLVAFFKNPVKYYFNKVLKIYYESDFQKTTVPEDEIFELNNPATHILKSDLLYLEENQLNDYVEEHIKKGSLPLKNMGKALVMKEYEALEGLRDCIMQRTGTLTPERKTINIRWDDTMITGSAGIFYGNSIVGGGMSSSRLKNWTEAYLNFLAARASGMEVDLMFIEKEENAYKVQVVESDRITEQEALARLKDLVEDFKSGHHQLYCYYPEIKELIEWVEKDVDHFMHSVNEKRGGYKDYYFTNEYLKIADAEGYFKAEHFDRFQNNTFKITEFLNQP